MQIFGREVIFSALFYDLAEYRCRRHLDIRIEGCGNHQDLTVVMLNPGRASHYKTDTQNSPFVIPPDVQVNGDPTLYRVAALMREIDRLKWIRVLNLSDIQNPRSRDFYNLFKRLAGESVVHSIFGADRLEELKSVIKPREPVYLAWGTSDKTSDLKMCAMAVLQALDAIILNVPTTGYDTFHPLVRPPTHNWKQTATLRIADFFRK